MNALKVAISIPRQNVSDFINAIEQGKVNDEDFAILGRLVEKRGREAAQVAVTPVDTVEYCSLRPKPPEPSADVHVNMEEKDEGWMNPELTELKSSSAGTGFETPGQQCHPIWKTGRTTANGFFTAGVGSNQGETSLHQRNTLVREPGQLRHRQNPGTRQLAKKTSNLTPVEKERRQRFGTRL